MASSGKGSILWSLVVAESAARGKGSKEDGAASSEKAAAVRCYKSAVCHPIKHATIPIAPLVLGEVAEWSKAAVC